MAHPEADQQRQFFSWLDILADEYAFMPARMTFAVPNGSNLAGGARAGKWNKEMGLRPGVPDILCPIPTELGHGSWNGLAIEMKVKGGRVRDTQEQWLSDLRNVGWQTAVCYSAVGAFNTWATYLNIPEAYRERIEGLVDYQIAMTDLLGEEHG